MRAGRLRQYGMGRVKAHALAGAGRQTPRAGIVTLDMDTANARCQTFIERRYRSPIAGEMNPQGVDFKLGKIDTVLRCYADQKVTFIIKLRFVDR
jgi:hypothetical protein